MTPVFRYTVHSINLDIRNKKIYGYGVGIWTVSEISEYNIFKGVGLTQGIQTGIAFNSSCNKE